MAYLDRDKQRAFCRKWMASRRAEWLAANGPCKQCGSSERLEVHHRDPGDKITHAVWSWSAERRAAELAKCDVLCHECHRQETTAYVRSLRPVVHGTRNRGYHRGCRCRPCTDAAAAYNRAYLERRANALISSPLDREGING